MLWSMEFRYCLRDTIHFQFDSGPFCAQLGAGACLHVQADATKRHGLRYIMVDNADHNRLTATCFCSFSIELQATAELQFDTLLVLQYMPSSILS